MAATSALSLTTGSKILFSLKLPGSLSVVVSQILAVLDHSI